MPAFCHFYGYTPQQFHDLEVADYSALLDYMHEYLEAQRKARS